MKEFVVDCSFVMTWFFEDEQEELAEKVLDQLSSFALLVPQIWLLEVINTLVVAERRKRTDSLKSQQFLQALEKFPIQTVPLTNTSESLNVFAFAREHKLSAYDACYLELAQRKSVPVASFDKSLISAAKRLGLEVWGK